MPTILLIRHAENDYLAQGRLASRIPGVHLNENGRAQAQALADRLVPMLKDTRIKAIFSSPLERAMETAEPTAKMLGVAITPHHGLIETDCGQWAGKTLKSLKRLRLWKIVQQSPSQFRFPQGETFIECQRRIVAAIQSICQNCQPDDVLLCFSHSDPLKLALAHFLGMPLDNFQRLMISPASMSVLQLNNSTAQLLALNCTSVFILPRL